MRKFSDEFKLKVIFEVLQGELSKEEVRRKYDIKGKSAVLTWMRNFNINQLDTKHSIQKMKKKQSIHANEDLIHRIKELERQLEDAQLTAEGYNIMIDIAEKELKIPIRKKYITKQSDH